MGRVRAEYDYVAQQEEELSFEEGEEMDLLETDDPDWYLVKLSNGKIGLAPSNYVEALEGGQQQQQQQQQEHHYEQEEEEYTTPPVIPQAPPQIEPVLSQHVSTYLYHLILYLSILLDWWNTKRSNS